MPAVREESVAIHSDEDVVRIRQLTRRWAVDLGFSLVDQTKIVTAASELARNTLVHGGGGTAFADWVKLWNSRGYAAIAMDNCGSIPSRGSGEPGGADNRPRRAAAAPA